MAPKKETPIPVTIKLKRHTTTIFISINGDSSLIDVKNKLTEMINETGGLKINDFDLDDEGEEEIDDDIEIPKPSFDTDSDHGEPNVASNEDRLVVKSTDIKLALPKDKALPYANEWIEIEDIDAAIGSLSIKENNILAFALNDEHFNILEPVDENDD